MTPLPHHARPLRRHHRLEEPHRRLLRRRVPISHPHIRHKPMLRQPRFNPYCRPARYPRHLVQPSAVITNISGGVFPVGPANRMLASTRNRYDNICPIDFSKRILISIDGQREPWTFKVRPKGKVVFEFFLVVSQNQLPANGKTNDKVKKMARHEAIIHEAPGWGKLAPYTGNYISKETLNVKAFARSGGRKVWPTRDPGYRDSQPNAYAQVGTSPFSTSLRRRHIFPLNPRHEEINDSLLAFGGDGDATRHLPPLCEAVAAAAGASVLGDENWVSTHRRLLPVVWRICRGEACTDEVLTMAADSRHPLLGDIYPISPGMMKAASEP